MLPEDGSQPGVMMVQALLKQNDKYEWIAIGKVEGTHRVLAATDVEIVVSSDGDGAHRVGSEL